MPKNRYQASQTSWPELDLDPNLTLDPNHKRRPCSKQYDDLHHKVMKMLICIDI